MSASEIDFAALSVLLLQWFAVMFGVYVMFLVVLRMSNYYKLKHCPNCSGQLKRSQRKAGDRFLKTTSLNILPVKRYRCYTCYWEGPALEIREKKKKNHATENAG